MKNLYIVLASQDFESANHRGLWEELSYIENTEVLVLNIPADFFISPFKGRFDRIKDTFVGSKQVSKNLKVIRPLLLIRPEVSISLLRKLISNQIWKIIDKEYTLENIKSIRFIVYNAFWAKIIKESKRNFLMAYYLFDEVILNANDNTVNKIRLNHDTYACGASDIIFLMSEKLMENRQSYTDKMILIGNGSSLISSRQIDKIEKSVGFIGNFRNWIDKDLLSGLIKEKSDYDFYFIGPIEKDMRNYFNSLLKNNPNVFYGGVKDKTQIASAYKRFQVIIIPYKNSEFIRATRPIKIVESVSLGTPVVTIPIDGYKETDFIKFSRTIGEFAESIEQLTINGIDFSSTIYKDFVRDNSWERKASIINSSFEEKFDEN
ncbi:glycosyltransferase [Streptococcus porcinus]|uniref:glycosyltransferase n=1 Tax=Streptococcus porcinus TaxID=1340 RepID=UPI0010CAB20C|nr:glycosyltransferase [Streptococcus porcinus]VTS24342.1 glycosyltransferase [Streptococcus porcinus]